jgi:hypothetical protein
MSESAQPKKKKQKIIEARGACLTDWSAKPYTVLPPGVQFVAWGLETCPSTGRLHNQAWAYGINRSESAWAKAFFNKPLWGKVELMRGTFASNETYCSKSGQYQKLGVEPMGDGQKRCLMDYTDAIRATPQHPYNFTRAEPMFAPLFVQYGRGLTNFTNRVIMDRLNAEGFKKREVYILTGSTETGKSRHAPQHYGGYTNIYNMPRRDGKWYGNYSGQPVVCFNDIAPGDIMSVTDFLNITDGHPCEVETKGDFVPWQAKTIFFTSNYAWTQWWPNISEEHKQAVQRRITAVKPYTIYDPATIIPAVPDYPRITNGV